MSHEILAIDEDFETKLAIPEAEKLKPIQKAFLTSYLALKDTVSVEEWLHTELEKYLPEHSTEEIAVMTKEIVATLQNQERTHASLEKAVANGRSKESWFASEVTRATSLMSAQEASKYLQRLDSALGSANDALYRTIHTQAGTISMNPQLDGFIAEQYHAQTFNLNAEASGSVYRAKVLEPNGNGYAKNSVDIVIVDGNGKVVRRYQSKYCKNAEATAQAFDHGDYRGQQKLVPEDQSNGISKKTTTVIEAPDGTKSTPLTKQNAKKMQIEAQSGKWNDLNWNEYRAKDLAVGIGKQAGEAALMGAAIGVGFDIAQKVWNNEEIDGAELIEKAVVSGADFGVKAAATGALKVGVEKGIIKAIPKGTPAGTLANIVYVAVENVKVVGKMVSGELDFKNGVEKMEQVTVGAVAGIATSAEGAAIGASIGAVFGPVGIAVGGFIGGTVGYMAGSKVGETIVKCVQKIREKAHQAIINLSRAAINTISSAISSIKNFFGNVASLFS